MPEGVAALLERIAAGRGYVLPHHRLLAEQAPAALLAYDDLYRTLTLEPGALDAAARERVWLALLAVHEKFSWRIHLTRARAAGLEDSDVLEALALASVSLGFDAWRFALDEWSGELDAAIIEGAYLDRFAEARGRTPEALAHLAVMTCCAVRGQQHGLRFHLPRALAAGATRAMVGEALGFVLLECGVNALIEALEAWQDVARHGLCPPPFEELP